MGSEHAIELESWPGIKLWATLGGIVPANGRFVSSGHYFSVALGWPERGGTSGGGAGIYCSGIAGIGQRSAVVLGRYLGANRVRYWFRPSGSPALEHHQRRTGR